MTLSVEKIEISYDIFSVEQPRFYLKCFKILLQAITVS